MSISITINGEGHEDVLHQLGGLAGGLLGRDVPVFHPEVGDTYNSDTVIRPAREAAAEVSPPAVETVAKPRNTRRGSNKDKATDVVDLNTVQPVTTAGKLVDAAGPTVIDTGDANPPDAPVIGAADPIVEAQDKADEVAETEANRDPEKPLGLDDIRNAAQPYVTKFSMAHAQKDLQAVLKGATGFEAISVLMASNPSQETLKKGIAAFAEAVAANPFGRAVVG